MWLNEESLIGKGDLDFAKPYVNASGTLGFAPEPRSMPFLNHLGAFITNPISRRSHNPAGNRSCIPFSGGFLLHTGYQNPGISRAIAWYKRRWASSPVPVIVHLLVETPEETARMVRKLEGIDNIMAVELGLPLDIGPTVLTQFMDAAFGELPVVICLNPEQVNANLETLKGLHPAAVHLTEPRGMLPNEDGSPVTGRLYGPAISPVMLHAINKLVDAELRVIANGGVYFHWQADTLLKMGVMAVGLGSVLWQVDMGDLLTGS